MVALNFNIQTTIKIKDGRDGPGKEKIHNYSIRYLVSSFILNLNDTSRRIIFSTSQW